MRRTGLFNNSTLNPSRKDELGNDPFGLRTISPVQKRSFAEAVNASCLNIDDIDLSKFNLAEAPDYQVPHRLFYIWFGSAFSDKRFQQYMTEWRKQNPNCIIIIFTDQVKQNTHFHLRNTSEDYRRMLEFAKSQQVCIVHHAEFMTATAPLYMGLMKKNYGIASDIFRLDLLIEMAGIYLDVDVQAMTLPDVMQTSIGFAINRSGVKAMNFAAAGHGGAKPFSNDFLKRASGDHQGLALLREIRQQLLTNMQMGWHALFKKHHHVAPHKYLLSKAEYEKAKRMPFQTQDSIDADFKNHEAMMAISYSSNFHEGEFHRIDSSKLKKVVTEVTTGPELLIDYQNRCDDVGLYASGFTASWLNTYTPLIKETQNQTCQRLLTIILFDLTQDPKTLRLDTALNDLHDPVMMQTVLNMLYSNFQVNLLSVNRIILSDRIINLYDFCKIQHLYQAVEKLRTALDSNIEVLLFPDQPAPFDFIKFINSIHYVYNGNTPKPLQLALDILPDIENCALEFGVTFCEANSFPLDEAELRETLKYFTLINLCHLYVKHNFQLWLDRFLQVNHQKQLKLINSFQLDGFLSISAVDSMQQVFSDKRFPQDCRDILIEKLQSSMHHHSQYMNEESNAKYIKQQLNNLDPKEITNNLVMLASGAEIHHQHLTTEAVKHLYCLFKTPIKDEFANASNKVHHFVEYCRKIIIDKYNFGLFKTLHDHIQTHGAKQTPTMQ